MKAQQDQKLYLNNKYQQIISKKIIQKGIKMREEVFKIHKYPLGHKVDKQLLVSIKDIFLQYE